MCILIEKLLNPKFVDGKCFFKIFRGLKFLEAYYSNNSKHISLDKYFLKFYN